MSRDQCIDQSARSIQSLLNTNGATFLMMSHIRSALWTLLIDHRRINFSKTLNHYSTKLQLFLQHCAKFIICIKTHLSKSAYFNFMRKKAGIYYHFIGNRKNIELTQFKGWFYICKTQNYQIFFHCARLEMWRIWFVLYDP